MGNQTCKKLCDKQNQDSKQIKAQQEIHEKSDLSIISSGGQKNKIIKNDNDKIKESSEKTYNQDFQSKSKSQKNYQFKSLQLGQSPPSRSESRFIQTPRHIQVKYSDNRIIVPYFIISNKISQQLRRTVQKSYSSLNINDQNQKWCLLNSGNYARLGAITLNENQKYNVFLINDYIFIGQQVQNKPHGNGIIIKKNSIFKGNFKKGLANGQGQYKDNKIHIKGKWQKGQIQSGQLTSEDFKYVGQFLNNKPHGNGQYNNYQMDIYYKGIFNNGLFDGQGFMKSFNFQYQGKFIKGVRNGNGLLTINKKNSKKVKINGLWQNDKLIKKLS